MPTITKIAQQKKKKDRYAVFLDDKYAFSVEEDVLVRFQLAKGLTLTKAQIEEITDRDEFQRAYLMAINYLSYRMRSVREMHTYLREKEVAPPWIDQIIFRLIGEKLLDDTAFSEAFVRDRMNYSTKGPRFIEKELMEKGVAKAIAKQATMIYDKGLQFQIASKWLEKEFKKTTRHSSRKREEQLKIKSLQKGFDQDVIADVFQHHQPEIDMEQERLNFTKQADKLYKKQSRKFTSYELKMKLKGSLYQKGFSSELINAYLAKITDGQGDNNDAL